MALDHAAVDVAFTLIHSTMLKGAAREKGERTIPTVWVAAENTNEPVAGLNALAV